MVWPRGVRMDYPLWDRPEGGEGTPPPGFGGFLCRIGFHKWSVIQSTGFTEYARCERCGRRDVFQGLHGHQPIDTTWITRGTVSLDFPPPRATPPPPPGRDWSKVERPRGTAAQPPRRDSDPVANRNLDALQREIAAWERDTFSHASQLSRARHLLREAVEVYAAVIEPDYFGPDGNPMNLPFDLRREVLAEVEMQIGTIARTLTGWPADLGKELGDVLGLLCVLAENTGTSLYLEGRSVYLRNLDRRYGPPDASGVSEHVREGG